MGKNPSLNSRARVFWQLLVADLNLSKPAVASERKVVGKND